MTPADLVIAWRHRARELEPYAAPAATAYTRAADELEAALDERTSAVLSLAEAAQESGYSTDHLRREIRRGAIPNAGRRNAPRIRRGDLPRKPGHVLTLAAVQAPSRVQIARSVVNSP